MAWMFEQKGLIEVDKSAMSEEDLMLIVVDAGAEDIQDVEDVYEIVTSVVSFEEVKQALDGNSIACAQASLVRMPQNMLEVQGKVVEQIIRLLEALEDLDDVQKVYSNFDVQEEELQNLMT